jgi:hypothetical protein
MTRPPHALRRLLGLVLVTGSTVACGTASGSPATAKTGLSAEFKSGAGTLFELIDDQLRISRDDATRDTHAQEARRQLQALRSQVTTDADGNVLLLLANFMGKINQRLILESMGQQGLGSMRTIKPEISSLKVQAANCDSELRLWLGSAPGEQKALEGGPCLKEARAAIATLNLQPAAGR